MGEKERKSHEEEVSSNLSMTYFLITGQSPQIDVSSCLLSTARPSRPAFRPLVAWKRRKFFYSFFLHHFPLNSKANSPYHSLECYFLLFLSRYFCSSSLYLSFFFMLSLSLLLSLLFQLLFYRLFPFISCTRSLKLFFRTKNLPGVGHRCYCAILALLTYSFRMHISTKNLSIFLCCIHQKASERVEKLEK